MQREYDKEKIMDKMRALRDKRDEEFLKKSEEGKQHEENKVGDVIYLGKIEINNQEIEIFSISEIENGKEIDKVYTENMECLGVLDEDRGFIPLEEMLKDDLTIEKLQELSVDEKISLNELEDHELEQIAKELGVKKEDLTNVAEIDLDKDIDAQLKKEEEEQELDKEDVKQLTGGKQEIKLNTKVDDKKTLGQRLDLKEDEQEGKEGKANFTKLVVVYTKDLKQIDENANITDTAYSFVAIRNDGTAKLVNDKLEMDMQTGSNGMKNATKVDADGEVKRDTNTKSRYKINGRDEYLSLENGKYGEIKAYYGKGKTLDGNESVETQLETSNVRPTDIELRRLQRDEKGVYEKTNEIAKEQEAHEKEGHGENVKIEDVDDIKGNESESHEELMEKTAEEIIKRNDEIDRVFTKNEVKEMLEEKINKNEKEGFEKSFNEIKTDVEKELNEEAQRIPTREPRSTNEG